MPPKNAVAEALVVTRLEAYASFFQKEGYEELSDLPTTEQEWRELSRVAAAGNSSEVRTYTYTDQESPWGQVFYRLRQVDLDGGFSYSGIRSVHIEPQIGLYPNPVQEILVIELDGDWKGEVIDNTGKTVRVLDGDKEVDPAGCPVDQSMNRRAKPYPFVRAVDSFFQPNT